MKTTLLFLPIYACSTVAVSNAILEPASYVRFGNNIEVGRELKENLFLRRSRDETTDKKVSQT